MNVRTICLAIVLCFFLRVATAADSVTPEPLPPAVIGIEYTHQIATALPNPSRATFTVEGSKPDWLTVSGSGMLTGTPPFGSDNTNFRVFIQSGDPAWPDLHVQFTLDVYGALCEKGKVICHQMAGLNPSTNFRSLDPIPMPKGDDAIHYRSDPEHDPNRGLAITFFDRANNKVLQGAEKHEIRLKPQDKWTAVTQGDDMFAKAPGAKTVWSIVDSKVLVSGSVLTATGVVSCPAYDWSVAALAKESSNVLIFGPSDISVFCDPDGQTLHTFTLFAVLPVEATWAEATGYWASKDDPTRKAPTKLMPPTECNLESVEVDHIPRNGIAPCDRFVAASRPYYHFGGIYNRLTQPGTTQGSISFSPVIGSGTEKFTNDVQFYVSSKVGPGWIGFPLVFEKDTNQKANLDSLTMALGYEFRWQSAIARLGSENSVSRLTIRKPELIARAGPELAPTTPHDLNFAATGVFRVPFVFDFQKSPSALTVFPVLGIEGGTHINSHPIVSPFPENMSLLRGVVGADASLRAPVLIAHGFLGTKPTTLDYSFRARYLASAEPYTDEMLGTATEVLTNRRRTYSRISLGIPYSTYSQFKISVQRGSLPPDFRSLGWSLSLGITFLNPGISEN